ncbi:hypothetical protein ACEPAF_5217 [Sanghuangporus sanghuang]
MEEEVAELTENLKKVQLTAAVNRSIAEAAQAQLTLAALHNTKLQAALNEKENAKSTDNVRIFDDGLPRVWTMPDCILQVEKRKEAKEKEAAEKEERKNNAKHRRDVRDAVEAEWKKTKAHHAEELRKWEAKRSRWTEEGLPRKHWDPKPMRPTKKQVQQSMVGTENNAESDEGTESD